MVPNIESQIGTTLTRILENPIVLDVETSTNNKGNPFDLTNQLVTVQIKQGADPPQVFFKEDFDKVIPILDKASCIIAFNSKFDLNWMQRRFGWKCKTVWCCQLAEFIFSAQRWRYPSLDGTCDKYGLDHKIDIVKTEYWEKGIDTPDIPREILAEYGAYDVELTWQVFKKQVDRFRTTNAFQFNLFRLHCNDLLVLQEMEFNGLKYDCENSLKQAGDLDTKVNNIESKLNEIFTTNIVNYSSNDHISSLLYGGTIKEEKRIPIGVYKTGAKTGQTRYKKLEILHNFDRIVEPLKNTELKKEGYYSTEESVLLSLKTNKLSKKIVTLLLDRAKIVKLQSTYLRGLPNLNVKMNWEQDYLFPTYNQCVTRTGRLSSVKPNGQNIPSESKQYCVSRYQ